MLEALNRGDEVITTSGIYGIIERIEENSIVIKVEGGTTLRVLKSTVAGKRPEENV
jgi:preprotein translocase subunit YajC